MNPVSEIFSEGREYVVELGSGDGKMLFDLSHNFKRDDYYYIGIELDKVLYQKSIILINNTYSENIKFLNDDFESVVAKLRDQSINTFLLILPHPNYIGIEKEHNWTNFYLQLKKKLKLDGKLILITEYTNELLSPVTSDEFQSWKNWLTSRFNTFGFKINELEEAIPEMYRSTFVKKFSQDSKRIRIILLTLS